MKRLEFGFFDAGGGHRAAATALKMAIEGQQRPWEVELANLQEILDPLDILKKLRASGSRISITRCCAMAGPSAARNYLRSFNL